MFIIGFVCMLAVVVVRFGVGEIPEYLEKMTDTVAELEGGAHLDASRASDLALIFLIAILLALRDALRDLTEFIQNLVRLVFRVGELESNQWPVSSETKPYWALLVIPFFLLSFALCQQLAPQNRDSDQQSDVANAHGEN